MAWNWSSTGELTENKTLSADDLDEVMPPIGSVIAWLKNLTGVPTTLPSGWVECNGQTISDSESPLNGVTVPDLNGSSGSQRFLRGSTTSGGTGGTETHNHSVSQTGQNVSSGSGATTPTPTDFNNLASKTANHLPPYYEVVWIIRIK